MNTETYAKVHATVNERLGDIEESDRITRETLAAIEAVELRKAAAEC